MKYNYLRNIKCDVLEYIKNHYDYEAFMNMIDIMHEDFDIDVAEHLHEEMWTADSVTGNASGSYTMSSWIAEDFLAQNLDLLCEALTNFGYDNYKILESAESCDVIIRRYLLKSVIDVVLYEINAGTIGGWE